jgi:hypothetical protein
VKNICLIFVAALFCWVMFADVQDEYASRLIEKIEKEPKADALDLLPLAIDAGPDAITVTKQMLSSSDENIRSTGADLLGYLGGEAAIRVLQEARRGNSKAFYCALCSAVASRGSNEDILFLSKALSPEPSYDWWEARVAAVFSLGVLRARETLPVLKQVAKEAKSSELQGRIARDVILWIRSGPISVIADSIGLPDRSIIATIFNCGIYGIRDIRMLHDPELKGYWIYKENSWNFQRGDKGGILELPEISFNIHLSPDGKRALAVVDFVKYPNTGYRYNYVLEKSNSSWKVQTLTLRGGY